MHFDILYHYPKTLGVLTVFFGIVLLFLIGGIHDHFDNRAKAAQKALEKKEARLAALPQLNTKNLIPVPETYQETMNVYERRARAGTFGVHDGYVLLYERKNGDPFLGFCTRETMEGLRDGEYVQQDHFVPICGRGQRTHGRVFYLGRTKIEIYPAWMDGNTSIEAWQQWRNLEHAFRVEFAGTTYLKAYREILPAATLRRFQRQHMRYHSLRASVEARNFIHA